MIPVTQVSSVLRVVRPCSRGVVNRKLAWVSLWVLLVLMLGAPKPVQAGKMLFAFPLQVTYTSTVDNSTTTADDVHGYILGITFGYIGFALDTLATMDRQDGIGTQGTTLDVFADIPIGNWTLRTGMGSGNGQITGIPMNQNPWGDAKLSKTFLMVGYMLTKTLDIHYGIHQIDGTYPVHPNGLGLSDVSAKSRETTLGFGFAY
ncbi:MAG: hypothetical protein OEW39_02725 [Deltaproteobacteria bacterium]|nr:hypothetical protein [Deltaproteobacteria bacterium]